MRPYIDEEHSRTGRWTTRENVADGKMSFRTSATYRPTHPDPCRNIFLFAERKARSCSYRRHVDTPRYYATENTILYQTNRRSRYHDQHDAQIITVNKVVTHLVGPLVAVEGEGVGIRLFSVHLGISDLEPSSDFDRTTKEKERGGRRENGGGDKTG